MIEGIDIMPMSAATDDMRGPVGADEARPAAGARDVPPCPRDAQNHRPMDSGTFAHVGSIGPGELLILAIILVGIVAARWFLRGSRAGLGSETPAPHRSAPAAAPHVVERERVVERQVVVMRCQHCGELTPADLSACKNCGAKLK
jgi:hypothetical protein